MLIIIFLIIIAFILFKNIKKTNIEPYRSYKQIQEERDNICYVYLDSFMDAHLNARDEAGDAFFRWCNDYKKITRYYPQYRSAEKVFLRLKDAYDRFYSF